MSRRRTIIVGAGLAGLRVAEHLAAAGDRVVLLEKYGFIGGRVKTSKHGYEIGAGRIHMSRHTRVVALLERFGLTTSPLSRRSDWRPHGMSASVPNRFDPVWVAILQQIRRLPASVLARHTLRELTTQILGSPAILEQFPYRGETEVMRADVAIRSFDTDMGTDANYAVVREGLSALTGAWAAELRSHGVRFHLNTEVTDVKRDTDGRYAVHTRDGTIHHGDRVILATHVATLRRFPVMRGCEPLDRVQMEPLTRIYAGYPKNAETGAVWFADMTRTITDGPLRYIIPVNPDNGIIMASYTDGRDTAAWHGLSEKALVAKIQEETRRLFPERLIPEPEWVRRYEWENGCTYWIPGDYDPVAVSRQIMQPRPATMPDLFVCGESFSVGGQAWMEGALEHADELIRSHLS